MYVSEDEKEVAERMCSFVIDVAKQAVNRSGVFTVGLSGRYRQLSSTKSDENLGFSCTFLLPVCVVLAWKGMSNHL